MLHASCGMWHVRHVAGAACGRLAGRHAACGVWQAGRQAGRNCGFDYYYDYDYDY